MKRKATGLSGVIALDKPLGVTSHDCIDQVRRITGERRIGHAGTLDPAASGLLLVCMGPAARMSNYLTGHDKRYEARIVFGSATDTDDAEGEVIRRAPAPEGALDEAFARASLGKLLEMTAQVPPAYSAIKRDGKKAYEVAREGGEVELEARPIRVFEAGLIGLGGDAEAPYWDVDLSVSKGTYIRALARDLGAALGSAAHLGALRRTRSGRIDVSQAVDLEAFRAAGEAFRAGAAPDVFDGLLLDPSEALGYPCVEIDEQGVTHVIQGRRLKLDGRTDVQDGQLVCVTHAGRLISIHEVAGRELVSRCVFNGGVAGCRR